ELQPEHAVAREPALDPVLPRHGDGRDADEILVRDVRTEVEVVRARLGGAVAHRLRAAVALEDLVLDRRERARRAVAWTRGGRGALLSDDTSRHVLPQARRLEL